MSIDNKINAAWNKFFSLKSPRFLVQPFFECFRAGFESAAQEDFAVVKLNQAHILQLKLDEAIRQRNYYASILNVNKDQVERFDKLIREVQIIK